MSKILKKILAGALALCCVAGFASCGKNNTNENSTNESIVNEIGADKNLKPYHSTVSAEVFHAAAVRTDGTVIAVKPDGADDPWGYEEAGQCDVSDWTDIVEVDTDYKCTYGLKSDGSVVVAGKPADLLDQDTAEYAEYLGFELDASKWSDIVDISANSDIILGVKKDGTVEAAGGVFFHGIGAGVKEWRDIVSVSIGFDCAVGLKKDGSVVITGNVDQYDLGGVSEWRDIVCVCAGDDFVAGLKSDGTVVAVGSNNFGQCDVSEWSDIVAIDAGEHDTYGLKADGSVVYAGGNEWGEGDVSEWRDIVAISAGGSSRCIGLKKDGSAVMAGSNEHGEYDVSLFSDIRLPQ